MSCCSHGCRDPARPSREQRGALRNAVEPYSFRFIERRLANAGQGLGDADLAEMDTLWDQTKAEGY